jgi:hypothetical protein
VTALVCAGLVLLALPFAPRDRRRGERPRPERAAVADIVRDRRLYPLAAAHTASFGLSVIVGTWAVSLLQHDGYGRRLAGAVAALVLLGGIVTRPLGGRILQRAGAGRAPARRRHAAGCGGDGRLLLDIPLGVRIAGAALLGLVPGSRSYAAFARAGITPPMQRCRSQFPSTAARQLISDGAPLVGFTFGATRSRPRRLRRHWSCGALARRLIRAVEARAYSFTVPLRTRWGRPGRRTHDDVVRARLERKVRG